MGGFDLRCALSGLPLVDSTVLLLMKDGVPVAVPFYGEYSGYGGIELVNGSATADALWLLEKTSSHPARVDLDALSQMLAGEFVGENWVAGGLEPMLVNGKLYDAVAATVLGGEHAQWSAFKRETLEILSAEDLCRAALPGAESRKLYGKLSAAQLADMKPELIRLHAFCQWPAELMRRECGEQYYSEHDLEEAQETTQPWLEYPLIATAVAEIVAAFGKDDESDPEDEAPAAEAPAKPWWKFWGS